MRHILLLLAVATLNFGQTFEVKDRNGIPMVTISDVKMTKYVGKTELQCLVKNISGQNLLSVSLQATAHRTDGSVVVFDLNVCDRSQWAAAARKEFAGGCDYESSSFRKDSTQVALNPFLEPEDFTNKFTDEIEFSFPAAWQSPEDEIRTERLKTERKRHDAQVNAAEVARRKRLGIPLEGYVVNPVVAKDLGCAQDYAKALSASGLQQRKMLAELLNYGCIQQLKGLFHVTPMDKRPVGAPRSLVEATLWLDVETMKNVGFSDDQMHSYLGADNTTFAIGWILETAYDKVGGEEIIKRFKQRQEPK